MSLLSRDAVARCAVLALAIAPAAMAQGLNAHGPSALWPEEKKVAPDTHRSLPVAGQEATPTKRSSWLEPRIVVRHTATSNARRDAQGTSDQITEISPGLRWLGNTSRVKGFVDYSLRGFHYARSTGTSHIEHQLNGNVAIEAVEQHLFVDVNGAISMQPISVFGPPVDGLPGNPNAAQTSRFGVSPYWRGRLGSAADYELRYRMQDVRSDSAQRSDARSQEWRVRVDNAQSQPVLGWALEAGQEQVDFSQRRSLDSTTLRARLRYAATPDWMLMAVAGAESTNEVSLARESHHIAGLGVQWRPSERTRVLLERENRYFGAAHNVLLEHRSAQTIWRYSDTQGVSHGLGAQSASLGGLFDLLYGFYAQMEPDPLLRSQRVQAEIDRLGLSADLQVPQDFLRSSSTLERVQQLSVALLGRRSMVTLAVMQSDNRRLGLGPALLGDDFDSNARIRQRGWSVLLAHRLTPQTALQASLSEQRAVGTALGQQVHVRSLALGLSTQLALRTSLGLQLRRSLSDGRASPYNESALVAMLTHRF